MTSTSAPPRSGYHHGNLVEALIQATIALIEERGVEAVSVREVAKRAGVSAGAPFRHFKSKTALFTAVAEQAMERLTEAVRTELERTGDVDPIIAIHAIGRGYLAWALTNPTHFQVISSRSLIDFHGSQRLVEQNEAIRLIMVDLVARAQREGRLRAGTDPETLMLSLRAFSYGVARMWIDGHFREWRVEKPPLEAAFAALDQFIALIAADGRIAVA
ncbi:MAG: TetR/AcrR family transcriptional regulator [Pseudomonadota bacterium]